MAEATTPAVTRDTLFGGRLILDQPAAGHRVGTDAVLLQAAVPASFSGQVIDAGAGVGAVGLSIALASPDASVTLIENDPTYLALASTNIAANSLTERARVADCDLLSRESRREFVATADLVVTNPPFHSADRVRVSPIAARRKAHVIASGGVAAWLEACLSLLSAKGTLVLIHQASTLAEILECLGGRIGGIALIAVHPRAGQPGSRIILRGRKGSRAPLRMAAPLFLHEGETFTPEAARLHAGISRLAW